MRSNYYYLSVDIKFQLYQVSLIVTVFILESHSVIKFTFKCRLTGHNASNSLRKVVFVTFCRALFLICCSLVLFQVVQRDGKVFETTIFIMGLVNVCTNRA